MKKRFLAFVLTLAMILSIVPMFSAVAWAYENKITDGTGENKFSPFEDCQRGQVVTFLYRNFVK